MNPVPDLAQGSRNPPVRDIIAKDAGVSHETVRQYKKIKAAKLEKRVADQSKSCQVAKDTDRI